MRARWLAPLLFLAFTVPASAATVKVDVTASYTPATVTILTGDSVQWCWPDGLDNQHTVTSDQGQYDFGPPAPLQTGCLGTFAFNAAGKFTYHDKLGTAVGTVVVNARPPAQNQPPAAAFSVTPNPVAAGRTVTFDASASKDPDGSIIRYEWDLDGDGSFEVGGTSPTTSRSYGGGGTVAVRLQVTDSSQNQSIAGTTLTVEGPAGPGGPASADSTPPIAAVALDRRSRVAARSGRRRRAPRVVRATVSCSEPCLVQAGVFGRTSRRAKEVRLGGAQVQIPKAGRGRIRVPVRGAARFLGRRGALLLRTRAIDRAGNVRTVVSDLSAPAAPAGPLPGLGISEQNATMFIDPLFSLIGFRYARLVVPWDAVSREPEPLDAWIGAARAVGVKPLISFEHARGDRCPNAPCTAPSPAQYTAAFKAFRARYPFITDYSPWNEANHKTQPTGPRPQAAARYFQIVKANCPGCRIVAADVLDDGNMARWITRFRRAGGASGRIWGLHNYRDTNRFRSVGTQTLLKLVRGQVWLTETGGIVKFTTAKGVTALPKDEQRAARSMRYLFALVRAHANRIRRVYIYNWRSDPAGRFDAGLLGPDGQPRLTFDILRDLSTAAAKR